jgi:hypothetical protein
MKILFITILTIMLSLVSVPAKGDMGMILAKSLCDLTAIDDRSKIRKKLKKAGVKVRQIYKDTTCNGMHLYTWAHKHGAEDAKKYYLTSMRGKIDDELEATGTKQD